MLSLTVPFPASTNHQDICTNTIFSLFFLFHYRPDLVFFERMAFHTIIYSRFLLFFHYFSHTFFNLPLSIILMTLSLLFLIALPTTVGVIEPGPAQVEFLLPSKLSPASFYSPVFSLKTSIPSSPEALLLVNDHQYWNGTIYLTGETSFGSFRAGAPGDYTLCLAFPSFNSTYCHTVEALVELSEDGEVIYETGQEKVLSSLPLISGLGIPLFLSAFFFEQTGKH
ncbi:MAG: hypothetical protein QS99_C0018G0036 [archaeon GW2011_AR4]|nr:MAG: hypothetical protein QS99_C0018G0036 [archaeon GW2011_AR4]